MFQNAADIPGENKGNSREVKLGIFCPLHIYALRIYTITSVHGLSLPPWTVIHEVKTLV